MPHFNFSGTNYSWPMGNSGAILTSTLGASERNLLYMQYGQTKTRRFISDRSLVLFLQRPYPASQVGKYLFRAFDLSYTWPSTWGALDTSTLLPTGTAGDVLIDNMMNDIMSGGVIRLQIPQFSDQYGAPSYVMYGTFVTDPQIEYPVDKPGWRRLTVSWCETQPPLAL